MPRKNSSLQSVLFLTDFVLSFALLLSRESEVLWRSRALLRLFVTVANVLKNKFMICALELKEDIVFVD